MTRRGVQPPPGLKSQNLTIKKETEMKTTHEITAGSTPDFRGIVIDPQTGRKCALRRDIAAGLGIQDSRVIGKRIYQDRFYDLGDVLENRRNTPRAGRPKNKPGIILSELTASLATALAGVALSATLLAAISEGTTPVLREMVGAREAQVRAMEELGFSHAADVRAQWEAQKRVANGRISELENLGGAEQ